MNNLKEVLSELSKIDSINSGGCGIAAYATYLWLKNNNQLSDDFAIIYLHRWNTNDVATNQAFLLGESNNAVACSHAVIRYNGDFYDAEGEFFDIDQFTYTLVIDKESIDKFMKASLDSNNWNWAFRRHIELPAIEQKLGVNLGVKYKLKY